jgi:hypothetical protein
MSHLDLESEISDSDQGLDSELNFILNKISNKNYILIVKSFVNRIGAVMVPGKS